MKFTRDRAWGVRVAALAAALVFPLLAVGSAQAAIAGGNPSATTQHPDVRTATTVDAQDIQVCFDKPLSPSSDVFSDPDEMELVGYNSMSNFLDPIGATQVTSNPSCVNLAFNTHSGTLDLGQFTAVEISDGAVTAGGQPSLADAVTLSTSNTHNGTRGLSSGPDLVGPAPVSSPANSIAFVFDQSIEPSSVLPAAAQHGFWYENAAGNFCFSSAVTQATPTTVIATFPTSTGATCNDTTIPAPSVVNARQAGLLGDLITNVSDFPISNAPQGTNMPNAANGGATNIASLTSATLDASSGDQVTFNFDHPLNAASITDFTKFHVLLSTGLVLDGSAVTPASPTSVVVTFSDLNLADEYVVQAFIDRNAVQTNPPASGSDGTNTYTSTPGAVALGGNAGAFSRGFTSGPDLYMVSFNRTSNVATLFFDQRIANTKVGLAGINLIDAAGNIVGNPSNVAIPSFPNPGPVAITIDVNPSVMALNPVQIQLEPFCEVVTFLGGDGCNIPQVVQQVTSGAHIKTIKHVSRGHRRHPARKARKPHTRARR